MNKCDECFGASNGDCDDCPFRTINAYTSKINEVNEEYLIKVDEREEIKMKIKLFIHTEKK